MSDLNVSCLVGRITRNAEFKQTEGGLTICNLSIVVNRSHKADNKWTRLPNFFNFTLFGKSWEKCAGWLVKGQLVSVLAHLEQDKWEKDGLKHNDLRVAIDEITPLWPRRNDSEPTETVTPETAEETAEAIGE
jgi:single-strand DNA-binding protein